MADFKRLNEINELVSFLGNGKVNIVAGLRRSGKTYLLTVLFRKHLIEEQRILEKEIGILKLNDENRNIETLAQLDSAVSKLVNSGIKVLIVDEAQLINGYVKFFSDFVKDNKNITLYISGSNSDILSLDIIRNFKELANSLYLRSLTYKEIIEDKSDYSFEEYMLYGGLPIIINEQPEKRVAELHRIYNEIYELDIRDRLEGKLNYLAKKQINEILSLLASSASPFSPSQVATRFTKGVDNTKFDMMLLIKDIEDILEFFDNSFLTSYIEVDDFNEKTPLKNIGLNKKYYFSDNGIRYINCENQNKARSNCLENAVYLELVSRGINPRGKIILNKKHEIEGEIDFNYVLNDKKYYIQATYAITEINKHREVDNFILLPGNTSKIIVYVFNILGEYKDEVLYLQGSTFFEK